MPPPQWANLGIQAVELNQYQYLLYFHFAFVNGVISPPCPEVTFDTFRFPVGRRLAARRAVFFAPIGQ